MWNSASEYNKDRFNPLDDEWLLIYMFNQSKSKQELELIYSKGSKGQPSEQKLMPDEVQQFNERVG